MALCSEHICRATHISHSQSKQAQSATDAQSKRMARSVSFSSNACWQCNTAWKPKASPAALGSRQMVAHDLLRAHHEAYRIFWRWSDAAVDHAMLHGSLHTVFGWHVHVGENPNPRSLRNFPMQANGAEMLRLACILATERGIEVCAPVHDALLICAPLERLDSDVARMQAYMAEASRIVLDGLELRTDATVIRFPDRYSGSPWRP